MAGTHSLHPTSTDNGIRLLSLATQRGLVIGGTLFPHKAIHKGTWLSPDTNTCNQIDHVLVNSKFRTSLCDVRAFRGADVDSDHYLVKAVMRVKLGSRKAKTSRAKIFDVERLAQDEIKTEYQVEIRNRFDVLNDEETDWTVLRNIVVETAGNKIGYKKKKRKEWYDEECESAAKKRRRTRITWLEERGNEEKRQEFRRARAIATRINRTKKRNLLNQNMREIESNRRQGRVREHFQGIREVRNGYQPRNNVIKSKEGRLMTSDEEIKERWSQYFQELLNRPEPIDPIEDSEAVEIAVEELSDEEIRRAVVGLKNNKAGGVDGIVAELLKYGGEEMQRRLNAVFQSIWETEQIPEEWSEGIYVPLHKKGDRTECGNYRGLCLLTIGYKIYAKILCSRLMPWYERIVGNYQAGFVPGRSTIDNIFIIRQINEKYREYCKTAWHIFVDYQQAYDSVNRNSVWNILRQFEVPEKLVRLIKLCYQNSKGRVRVGGDLSDPFHVETGLRQGCPLSCMLFNIVLEKVIRDTPAANDPIELSNTTIDRLAYADDCDLVGETFQGRDEQLQNFNESGQRAGLEIKEMKTKAMKMGREERTEDFIDLGGFMLEEVDSFRYLGSIVNTNNTMEEEVMTRIGAASKCSWSVNSILRSKDVSRTTKLRLYTSVIRPVAVYACETWALTKELERRLFVFENGILRRIYGRVRDVETGEWRRRHNRELRELSRLPPITSFVKSQRLRWAGHVARMADDALPRRVLDGIPEGRRPLGRPRLRWSDCVKQDLQLLGVADPERWREMAQDRRRWRLLVAAAKDHPGPMLQE